MLDEKTGFDIGWDYYSFEMFLPGWLDNSEFDIVINGYKAAKSRMVTQVKNDRFVKKWLLLRINAWRRNRLFDPAVTPEFIRLIDRAKCPITGIKLTCGTGYSSDWSVDRINNDAAYSPGNLVVVSVLANIAKGGFSYGDIRRFAYDDAAQLPEGRDLMRSLTRVEWMRWAAICSHIILVNSGGDIGFDVAPCVTTIPRNIPINSSSSIQIAIGMFVSGFDTKPLNSILAALPKNRRRHLREVVTRAAKVSGGCRSIFGIWFSERLFTEFRIFYKTLSDAEISAVSRVATRTMCSVCEVDIHTENWGAEDAGYNAKNNRISAFAEPV